MPHTLSELTGPVYGHDDGARRTTMTSRMQRKGEPLGERIIVHGRVLDEDGRGVPNTLVEIWQANAAGRYIHVVDQHPAPLDPNFTGAGRTHDRRRGLLPLHHHQARRLSVGQSSQRLAAGAHPLLGVRAIPSSRAWSRRCISPAIRCSRSIRSSIRSPTRRRATRMISRFDLETTKPEWALGYQFDIVLRGRNATPMESS